MKKPILSLNILPIVRKEFRQIKRDRRILSVLLFIPALMLLMFGYALNFDVKHTSMAIYDEDRSSVSRDFAGKFFISEYFCKAHPHGKRRLATPVASTKNLHPSPIAFAIFSP